jgi:hypothetical protein
MGSCPTSPAGLAYYDPAAMRRQLAFPGPPWAINYELASLSDGFWFRGVALRVDIGGIHDVEPLAARFEKDRVILWVSCR